MVNKKEIRNGGVRIGYGGRDGQSQSVHCALPLSLSFI